VYPQPRERCLLVIVIDILEIKTVSHHVVVVVFDISSSH
jgi:hypothetical protein